MSRPTTYPSPWRDLAEKLSGDEDHGVEALAEELQSARGTVRQWWALGMRTPNRLTQAFIVSVFQKHGIEPPTFSKKF